MTSASKLSVIAIVSALVGYSSQTSASVNSRCNTFYAADSYHQQVDSEQLEIIQHAEPDLPPADFVVSPKTKKKPSTNFFSWLTNSHTMPSLHFIEFIELLGHEND
ncbi:hypothetical protein [Kangiella sp. TOML190]|uniref:hypothetical protein n=1 Tax=Kangiella sp. TOML190 TaxID=2931351 RepID=UPI002040190F|nr:hypothetical protein [Kangiella sp. TOML190]